ncbi:NUDIX domain-containing protein [Methanobrevibacter wolinii]|uniref:NUDIX domain-containing protein n=1 Tax=Methanobrevibacter wolinii TaxID=190977 RepID=UPI0005B2C7B3|nr:NUDIX domain-containing protein [Methanobrevibacter wolinii]
MKKGYGLSVRGIAKKNEKILVLKRHPKSKTFPNQWEFPGGKAEHTEYFDETLRREFKEETNLKVEPCKFYEAIEDEQAKIITIQIYMYVNILEDDEVKISDEHIDYAWKNINELKTMDLSHTTLNVLKKKNWKI